MSNLKLITGTSEVDTLGSKLIQSNLITSTSNEASEVKTLGSKLTQLPTFSRSHMHTLVNNITAALKVYEEEIVYFLVCADLRSIVRSCVKIISLNVKKGLESLDNNVSRRLAIRFLMQHAYEKMEGNTLLFKLWLDVLAQHGVSSELLSSIRQSCVNTTDPQLSMETMHLAEGVEDVLHRSEASDVIGAKLSKHKNLFFSERHISALTEILAHQSCKWMNIGVSLNLPYSVLVYMYDESMSLNKMLYQWIVEQHEHAKPPTVENLKQALRSQTVGLGAVANQLDDDLLKHGICLDDESFLLHKRPLLGLSTSEGVGDELFEASDTKRPKDMFFSERHISALTEILANQSHKWMNIGVSLNLPSSVLVFTYNELMSLNKMLYQWIAREHEYAQPPTVENLKKALRSQTVGLGAVANQLDDDLLKHGIYLDDESFLLHKWPLLGLSTSEGVGDELFEASDTKRPKDMFFSERHISALTEILANQSHKWMNIGVSLNLPSSVLVFTYNELMSLNKMLYQWIVEQYEYAKPTTVENLKQALRSQTVGLGAVANQLDDDLLKHGICLDDESFLLHKRPLLGLSTSEGVGDELFEASDTKRPKDMFFSERHISALTEILAHQSHKWVNLGASLNLPSSVLVYIYDECMSLNKMLYQWIVEQHEHAKPPTVENLKQALKSQTVGLGAVANQLDDDLIKHGICLDDESFLLHKRPLLGLSTSEGVKRPKDMFFSERHISALIDILVHQSHKWMNIGVSLNLPSSVLVFTYNELMSLKKMLYQWIVGQHEYAKPPTVENLKQALRSQTVGLGAVAYHLDDDLLKHGIHLDDESFLLHKRPLLGLSTSEGVGDELFEASDTKRPKDMFFSERHISALTEILAHQSHKWMNIGASLNLPSSVLVFTYNGLMSLKNMLYQWIAREHEHAKPPTVENLKQALRSQTVGLGAVANQLDDDLIKHGICLDDESFLLHKRPLLGLSTSEGVGDELFEASDTKRPKDMFFSERHILALTEILAHQSHKWMNIGTSLNLPSSVLVFTYNGLMSLKKMLYQWIAREHEHAKPSTVENLKQALRSQTVGLGAVANQLDDDLLKHGICLDDESFLLHKRPLLGLSTSEGVGDELFEASDTKRPKDMFFSERHISALTEILAHQSHKWMNIGASLNLPSSVLVFTYNGLMSLKKMLYQWIAREHEHAKPPTVENLKQALRSQTVGLGAVANQLDDDLIKHGMLYKWPLLESSLLTIFFQSLDILVKEGKSTLLEVHANARHNSPISYQWVKNGLPLIEGGDYIGCNRPILCLNNSCIADGAYVCKVTILEDSSIPVISSKSINVSVSVSPLKKVLMDRYCAQPEIPEDSWPPRGGNTYINLALIKQGNLEKAGEYARNTIQGDIDDVLASKDSIEYEDVFTDLESGTRLLIEGRPGSGKTTLVHKFSQDWGRGKYMLHSTKINLLFLVHLRGFFNDPGITLRDVVQHYYANEQMHVVDQIMQFSVDHNGEGLCFVLDGLDEYNPTSKNRTFIFKLIKRQLLSKAIVIIASRPAATAKLRNLATKQIEVIGFLKSQIHDYIEKYHFSDFYKREDLHKYLNLHPNVHHMCYLPIHSAMVCYLFDMMGSKLPRTETKMYTEFTNHTLLRTLTRYDEINLLESADRTNFLMICKLAFKKTAASNQVFRTSEIRDIFGDLSCGSESMGLITVDSMASVCGFEKIYTFLHLTFQEYLAAYHISKLEEENQLEIISNYGQKKHMNVVWKFYCGLVNFSEQEQKLRKLMPVDNDLFNAHCAFESRQSIACNCVVQAVECGTLTFNNNFLTPSDSTAIGYVVNNSAIPVEKIVLNRCNLGLEGVDSFLDEVGNKISSLKALSYHGRDCFIEQFKLLNSCLQNMISLEVLDISDTKLGAKKVKLLTENLTLPNLETLILSSSIIQNSNSKFLKLLQFNSPKFKQVLLVDGYIPDYQDIIIDSFGLFPFLYGCGSLKIMNLQNYKLDRSELEVLSEHYSCCTSLILTNCRIGDNIGALKNLALLELFDVSANRISDSGVMAIAENIQHCTKLQSLNISFNWITDIGALIIAESLKLLINLKEVDLSYNQISDVGAIAVTRAIRDLKGLKLLLWNHKITKEGASTIKSLKQDIELETHVLNLTKAVLDILNEKYSEHFTNVEVINFKWQRDQKCISEALTVLKYCTKIQTLKSDAHIGADGTIALAGGLKFCTNLQNMDLSHNNIGIDGAKAIGHCIHSINLQSLHLGSNGIGFSGAKALINGLESSIHLQTLNLNSNDIGADGAQALADGLKHCTNLQTLDLSHNDIGSDGVKVLAHCMHFFNLQTLNLSSNGIGAEGVKALVNSLTNLQTLNLADNDIGLDGAKALANGLIKHYANVGILHTAGAYACNISVDDSLASTVYSELMEAHEKEVNECLQNANLEAFSREMTEIGVISQEVKESFDSLDSTEPHHMKINHLLTHAYSYKRAVDNPGLYETWFKLLSQHGFSRNVLCSISQSYIVPISATKKYLFLELHVQTLTEILVGQSSEWQNIGISLNLPRLILEDIKSMFFDFGPIICLFQLLYEWIVVEHEDAKAPTVDNLKLALETVGLSAVADQLEDNLFKHGINIHSSEEESSSL